MKALKVVWQVPYLKLVKLAEVVSYSAKTLVLSNCALKFKCVIMKSLMIKDKSVGEEAKVERGVLFIMQLRSRIAIWKWYCLCRCSLNDKIRANITRYRI